MEVHSLLRNRVQIAERDLALEKAQQQKAQQMNFILKTISDISNNPSLLWILATVIVMLCVLVSSGVNVMCTILAMWITASLIFYYIRRYGS